MPDEPQTDQTPPIRDRVKELRRVRAGDLAGAPWNWRQHGEAQRNAVSASIDELGFFSPIEARELEDGTLEIIDGHLRADLVNVNVSPDTLVPVIVTDLDEADAKKANLIKDPLAGMATANQDALSALMAEATTNSAALQEMLEGLARDNGLGMMPVAEGQTDPDAVPEPPDKAITQPGDLWLLGDHRLLCGDSSKPEDVDKLLDGAAIHLVNTDPPYNVKVEPRSNNAIAAGLSSFPGTTHHQDLDLARHPEKSQPTTKKLRAKDRPLTNDFVSAQAFEGMLAAWFGNLARVLQLGRAFYVWGGYSNIGNIPTALATAGLYFSQAIIWVKEHPVLTRKDFMGNHEWCFYGWREGAAHQFLGPNNAVDVWSIKKINPQSMVHLTEKPVELATRAMQYSSRPGENVLDLFGGSGSTLIAAQQTGRKAFLMEVDPLYCDVIIQRWEQFTGGKAEVARAAKPKRQKRKPK